MAEPLEPWPGPRAEVRSARVARMAGRQEGLVSHGQLIELGMSPSAISRWLRAGRLHPVHRGVYAVGHTILGTEGRVRAALLYAGPEAGLSHTTAAWWWRLIKTRPYRIHISSARDIRSTRAIEVHRPKALELTHHRRLPVTTVARTLLDLAATLPFADVRRALAEADHRRLLRPQEVERVLGRGRPGSAALRRALERHLPALAETLSVLEERFLILCESSGMTPPEVNVKLAGLKVDALWRGQRVIVELDGHEAHSYPAAAERDRRRDLVLRGSGYEIRRYTWQQITEHPEQVIGDLSAALGSNTEAI